ncbi:hypothetical protein TCON_0129 [Astathelohania contejeani]|uniref:SCP domain-containing protein n=1 Tax=Astathelohania contejeani TaxID=164912 RepID=A0ABQ7I2V2_9MICR|nr:hypothetical protein TCON_0129 [Thelohania contejeani]
MIALTNKFRREMNMDDLQVIDSVSKAAQMQADNMCAVGKLTHEGTGKEDQTLEARLRSYDFVGENIGENIAKHRGNDAKEVFKVWKESKDHRKNILGDYTYTGVGTCIDRNGFRYWAQVFGKDLSNKYIKKLRENGIPNKNDKEKNINKDGGNKGIDITSNKKNDNEENKDSNKNNSNEENKENSKNGKEEKEDSKKSGSTPEKFVSKENINMKSDIPKDIIRTEKRSNISNNESNNTVNSKTYNTSDDISSKMNKNSKDSDITKLIEMIFMKKGSNLNKNIKMKLLKNIKDAIGISYEEDEESNPSKKYKIRNIKLRIPELEIIFNSDEKKAPVNNGSFSSSKVSNSSIESILTAISNIPSSMRDGVVSSNTIKSSSDIFNSTLITSSSIIGSIPSITTTTVTLTSITTIPVTPLSSSNSILSSSIESTSTISITTLVLTSTTTILPIPGIISPTSAPSSNMILNNGIISSSIPNSSIISGDVMKLTSNTTALPSLGVASLTSVSNSIPNNNIISLSDISSTITLPNTISSLDMPSLSTLSQSTSQPFKTIFITLPDLFSNNAILNSPSTITSTITKYINTMEVPAKDVNSKIEDNKKGDREEESNIMVDNKKEDSKTKENKKGDNKSENGNVRQNETKDIHIVIKNDCCKQNIEIGMPVHYEIPNR